MSQPTSAKYRKDIEGLRALAILPITLFHAGIPGFPGGYVGVDIFFVISGFLITTIIAREIEGKRFSYVDFYERRIRRIFPALMAMLLFSLIAAYFILLPSELIDFAKSVIGTLLFASNVVFFKQSGYFDGAAEYKPLLHTWSLGIEEQFYIIFPFVLFLIFRYFPNYVLRLVGLCLIVSLAMCIYLTPIKSSAAFFLIPTRAWELIAGALLALGAAPKVLTLFWRTVLSGVGVILIIAAIIFFDTTTPFPGVAAMLPVAGTALVVKYGDGTPTGRVLSIAPLGFIGRISYSLYLWHWPLIVIGRDLGLLDGTLGPAICVVILSIMCGYLSYRFVETPFRDRQTFDQRKIYVLAFCGGTVLFAAGIGYLASNGLRGRYSPQVLAFDDGRYDISPMRQSCHPDKGTADPVKACVFGGTAADTALWGDSHGVELAFALGNNRHPLRSMTYSACPPVIGLTVAGRGACKAHNQLVAAYLLKTPQIRTVVLTVFFSAQMRNPDFAQGFEHTVDLLTKAGKSVIVIGPTPAEGGRNLPVWLARHGEFRIPRREYEAREQKVSALLGTIRAKGVRIILPSDYLCDGETCRTALSGRPVLFDEHHLSMSGARYLASRIAPLVWNDPTMTLTFKDRSR